MNSFKRYNKDAKFVILSDRAFDVPGAKIYTIAPHYHMFKHKQHDRMGDGVYYKFYLPELPYDKILYVDCDVLCQRPLNELWYMPCEFINATESHQYGKQQAAELGLEKYALSGMMVMNLKALRAAKFTEKCLKCLSELEEAKWHDETVINKLFNDKICFIDKKYNYCKNRIYDDPIPESDAYLLHFVGTRNKAQMLRLNDFMNLSTLKQICKGKRVAIVGNASSLLEKGQGPEIDAHDIVIRFNKGFPSAKVGHKTHIVFLACTLTVSEQMKYRRAYLVRRSNLCRSFCHYALHPSDRTRYAQVPNQARANMGAGLMSQASTGYIAIQFALSTECSSIDLYGFDFFKTDTYYNPEGYVTLHNGNKEEDKILEYAKYGLVTIK